MLANHRRQRHKFNLYLFINFKFLSLNLNKEIWGRNIFKIETEGFLMKYYVQSRDGFSYFFKLFLPVVQILDLERDPGSISCHMLRRHVPTRVLDSPSKDSNSPGDEYARYWPSCFSDPAQSGINNLTSEGSDFIIASEGWSSSDRLYPGEHINNSP